MIKIALCDDDSIFLKAILNKITEYSDEKNIDVQIDSYNNGQDLIDRFKENNHYDLVILDIDMPKVSGREVVKELRNIDKKFKLIFMTSLEEEVFSLIKYDIFRYIRKRYLKEELNEALDSVFSTILMEDKKYNFELKDGMIKLSLKEILYFVLVDRTIEVHTIKNIYSLKVRVFNDISEFFIDKGFVSIYRGCIVNLRHITRINKREIYLDNGEVLEVSRVKIKNVTNSFFEFREEIDNVYRS